jgi:hypothetical protein
MAQWSRLPTQPAKLEATIKAIADHGAAFMGANLMYLKGGTRDHFMGFIAKQFPHMVEGYNKLYAGAYAKADYVKSVRAVIDALQQRYDVRRRASRLPPQAEPDDDADAGPDQPAFSWVDDEV